MDFKLKPAFLYVVFAKYFPIMTSSVQPYSWLSKAQADACAMVFCCF